jgi:long-chain fatty acid transport protein
MLACGSALNASANGFRLASQDAFATARGEAFVATADNPSAIYYNPAGITQLEGNNLRGGLYGIYLSPTFVPTNGAPNGGNTYHSSDRFAAIPQFFYTHTFTNSPLSLGLGVYAPYGGSISWPDDTGFRSVASSGSLTYIRINPVAALKLAPQLSVGGGVTVDYGNIDFEQGLLSATQPPNFYHFTGDGWSVGFNFGLLCQPIDQISIGVTVRSPTTITMKGHTTFGEQPFIQTTQLPAQADFAFPLTAVFGISYRPTPKWNLEFDADYTDWSSFGTTTIYQQGTVPFGVKQNVPVNLDWQASWMFEFGVTRYFDKGWHVSAGYVFNENSVPNAYYTPLAADLDRHFISVGAGHKGKRFDFDIAYQFGYGPANDVTGSTPSSIPGQFANQTANGTYRFISHAVLVTAGLHF